ncbi:MULTISPECIES: acetate/propionate family kinase [Bradyrhizobium]|uniref:Acetate kinase n=3 Tax=Bradyrhizobium elkanii TaxID=29448 RepID=A0ABV4FD17_BRAEL|nr:acetate/propionate family kinase [Bradyrhizobium elkanii]MBP2431750.1 acetate kinase [Bradyrhizobium elkanii]MCP1752721.1 acetate kinase [Bradyrhizobium elkanii]MCP1966411.1 acetate kinase [Bradyrhizobium elkanii]MCS3522575.1 acetate kinase [Bradyrhizobium elkanii]MCS3886987.1 acetate kinase [Bradyrhizobium elkanii]
MSDSVLVLNAGSSSIKFGLFDIAPAEPKLQCRGLLDEQEKVPRIVMSDASGRQLFERRRPSGTSEDNGLFSDVFAWIEDYLAGGKLAAVGHRIVHGGRAFYRPVVITGQAIAALEALTPLAPLHQPRCLAPVRAVQSLRPQLTQIACFDTAFHHGLAPPASRFAIPRHFEERGIRRYGFHGLSFEYVASQLAAIAPQWADKRVVVAHLGNGASLCALQKGNSVDTTMGLTPLDGLVMGTRCGTIDPGVLLYLLQEERMSVDDVQHLLYEGSGLLGVSGLSADMRALLASQKPEAREAVDLFTFRVAAEVAVMANTLAGLDGLVFTGGIGEHAADIRQRVCDRLSWLGVSIDTAANAQGEQRIAAKGSPVDVLVIPTNEEVSIARHCRSLLRTGR